MNPQTAKTGPRGGAASAVAEAIGGGEYPCGVLRWTDEGLQAHGPERGVTLERHLGPASLDFPFATEVRFIGFLGSLLKAAEAVKHVFLLRK